MNIMLTIAGTLSAMAAILHIACIYFGAPWYRLLGAGEHMSKLAEQGCLIPTAITSAIVLVLFIWSLYAFSAAGLTVQSIYQYGSWNSERFSSFVSRHQS
jgi:hypothetical protein